MTPRESLRRRIAQAYLVFAAASTLFFAIIAIYAVEGIEEYLVDNRLKEIATWASPRHAAGLPVAMPTGVSFHHGDAIPISLRALGAGVHEVEVDNVGLHVLSGTDSAGSFVVVDHESDYEKVEQVVYSLFVLAFVGNLLLAGLVGRYIGSRVVTPIQALADAVSQRSAQLPLLDGKDELGVLARAFADHTRELHGFLDRERFFTGDVSHELRTPLAIISGAAELLLDQHGANAQVAAPAERILRAANEATDRMQVLLMLARTRERIPYAPTDIGAIAEAETVRYQGLVAGKDVALRYAGGPSFSVGAPPELCASLIGNLVRNACQYTESGAVTVHLGQRTLAVEDSGPGLPPAALSTLAGGFPAHLDGAAARTGIGLGLVLRICDYLGATLEVRAREGGGSVVEIHFGPDPDPL